MIKSYGISNEVGIPEDEMILARLVQNAKATGLRPCKQTEFRDRHRHTIDMPEFEDHKDFMKWFEKTPVAACCALGASNIAPDTFEQVKPFANDIPTGNDEHHDPKDMFYDYQTPSVGFDIGRAFQDAAR